jgi:hypothetical protein
MVSTDVAIAIGFGLAVCFMSVVCLFAAYSTLRSMQHETSRPKDDEVSLQTRTRSRAYFQLTVPERGDYIVKKGSRELHMSRGGASNAKSGGWSGGIQPRPIVQEPDSWYSKNPDVSRSDFGQQNGPTILLAGGKVVEKEITPPLAPNLSTNAVTSLDTIQHASTIKSVESTDATLDDNEVSSKTVSNSHIGLPIVLGTVPPTIQKTEHISNSHSQLGSQTDSTLSDDATDWDDDSDAEDSFSITPFLRPSILDTNSGAGPSTFQMDVTSTKSALVDRLMLDFWAIFDNSWSRGVRQHGSSTQTTSSSEAVDLGIVPGNFSSARNGKRSRKDDRDDGESDGCGDQRRKRAPRDKIPLLRGDGQPAGYFACPFRKHDPRKYSLLEWPRCSEKPQKSIARLK